MNCAKIDFCAMSFYLYLSSQKKFFLKLEILIEHMPDMLSYISCYHGIIVDLMAPNAIRTLLIINSLHTHTHTYIYICRIVVNIRTIMITQ